MTVETLFDIIQTPVIGAIAAFVVFRQVRKTQPDAALKYALLTGVGTAVLYAALKYVF
jgi:multidrug transporter EmrE-like cation transporter